MKCTTLLAMLWMLAGAVAAPGTARAETYCAGLQRALAPQLRGADAVFIRSYEPGKGEAALPLGLSTSAFVYDNALVAIALVGCGDLAGARPIGEALRRAVHQDRSFTDGRLRNAYRAGPLLTPAPLLPGWWDKGRQMWAEDAAQNGTSTGNVAWAALALLTLHEATKEASYLGAARRLIDWVIVTTACEADGFCGGVHGFDPQQVRLTWMSTEHNVDVGAAARWLFRLTGEPRYQQAAQRADRLLARSFRGDHFLLGTRPDGAPADDALLALDVQLWPWMANPAAPAAWRKALGFAESRLAVDGGFDFNGDRDGLWVEGTAQAALAYRINGDPAKGERLLASLRADLAPSGLLNATRGVQLTTGLSIDPTKTVADFFYFRRPHIGATAWAALAETGWNPFTGVTMP